MEFDNIYIIHQDEREYPSFILENVGGFPDFEDEQQIEEVIREHNCSFEYDGDDIIIYIDA